jgi:hypothetical protein
MKYVHFRFLCKATQQEKTLQSEEADFYKQLTGDYAKQFANQSAILSSLNATFQPILAAGPGQFGFTPQETTSLRTGASDTIAQTSQSAQAALDQTLAARGGGNVFIPSGAANEMTAQILTSQAAEESSAQNQITQAGYAQGNANFNTAASILGNTAAQYNPIGYAGASTSANQAAFNEAQVIQQQDQAWEGQLGGILGGVAGAFLGGPAGAAIGSQLGGGNSNQNPGNAYGGSMSLCWIAAAVFNEDLVTGPRVNKVRDYLLRIEPSNFLTRTLVGLYRTYGKQIALFISKSKILLSIFRGIFNKILRLECR